MKKNIGLWIGIAIIVVLAAGFWLSRSNAPTDNDDKVQNTVSTTNSTNTATTPTQTETPAQTGKQAGFTAAQVASHNSQSDCYTIVGGKVYNLTSWIAQHPGGAQAIIGLCGIDGSAQFERQHGSNAKAQAALASFLVGDLIQ